MPLFAIPVAYGTVTLGLSGLVIPVAYGTVTLGLSGLSYVTSAITVNVSLPYVLWGTGAAVCVAAGAIKSLTGTAVSAVSSTASALTPAAGASGGGSDNNDGSDDIFELIKKAWKFIAERATRKAKVTDGKFRNERLYEYGKNQFLMRDRANHAGAAFKLFERAGRHLNFKGSLDSNLKLMSGKHESLSGLSILWSDLKFYS